MENDGNRRMSTQVEKKLYTKLIAEINDDEEICSKVSEFKLKRRQEMNCHGVPTDEYYPIAV